MTGCAAIAYQASDGAAFHRFLGRRTTRLADLLIDFARPTADGVLLDIGCGTGRQFLLQEFRGDRRPRRADCQIFFR